MKTVLKILTALAAVAGAIYIVATYGEQIVAWAKKMMGRFGCCCCCDDECECDCDCCCNEEELTEEITEEASEEPAEDAPVAAEQDFEG